MSPDPITPIATALTQADAKFFTLVYKDLAKPGVQQVGKALSTVLGLGNTALLPLKLVNEKAQMWYAKHMEQYRLKLEDVPEEKIVEVAPEVGVPIMENLEKTTNEKVSELYINLLANASNIDFVTNTHPRFVAIIESLTSDEIIILEHFRKVPYTPYITISRAALETDPQTNQPTRNKIITVLNRQATKFEKSQILTLPQNAKFYFQNLEGLSLLKVESERHLMGDAYENLLREFNTEINEPQKLNSSLEVKKGWYELTEFGILFLDACQDKRK